MVQYSFMHSPLRRNPGQVMFFFVFLQFIPVLSVFFAVILLSTVCGFLYVVAATTPHIACTRYTALPRTEPNRTSRHHPPLLLASYLEVLALLEEHRERDDCPVDEQAADNRHDHGRDLDDARVCQGRRQSYNHTTPLH
jgi:hypothetical protein